MIIKNRDVAIITAGGLAIAGGVVSAVQMIFGFLSGWFMLNLGVLAIPIGFAILRGDRGNRTTAIVFAAIGCGMCLVLAGLAAYLHFWGSEATGSIDAGYYIPLLMLISVGCALVFKILRRSDVTEWFLSDTAPRIDCRRYAVPILIVTSFLATAWEIQRWWTVRTLDAAYPIRIEVVPRDSETMETLRSIGPVTFDTRRSALRLQEPNVTTVTVSSSEIKLLIEGMAARPLAMTIEAEGYEAARLVIDRTTPERISVAMKHVGPRTERDGRTADAAVTDAASAWRTR